MKILKENSVTLYSMIQFINIHKLLSNILQHLLYYSRVQFHKYVIHIVLLFVHCYFMLVITFKG